MRVDFFRNEGFEPKELSIAFFCCAVFSALLAALMISGELAAYSPYEESSCGYGVSRVQFFGRAPFKGLQRGSLQKSPRVSFCKLM